MLQEVAKKFDFVKIIQLDVNALGKYLFSYIFRLSWFEV